MYKIHVIHMSQSYALLFTGTNRFEKYDFFKKSCFSSDF